jgi:hypothetical protein
MRVRRLARAADDGFHSDLVPGLHASADAALLAGEIAFAAARIDALAGPAPPGTYGEARALAARGEREEALWLLFQTALLGPLEDDEPFAEIARRAVPWAGGGVPDLGGAALGPRGAGDGERAARAAAAYRAFAGRGGGQAPALAGEAAWTPERRADRAFERLALPGLGRAPRYEFLLAVSALGLADLRLASLHLLEDPRDPTVGAAKRVFGIGDPLLVARRAGDLAAAAGGPALAALDLGLVNWARRTDDPSAERLRGGVSVAPDEAVEALVRDALGLASGDAGDAEEPPPG